MIIINLIFQLCLETGKLSQAEKYLTQLIHRNPEKVRVEYCSFLTTFFERVLKFNPWKAQYYHMLADCVGASTDQNRLLEFYEVMQSTFPRAKVSIPEYISNKFLLKLIMIFSYLEFFHYKVWLVTFSTKHFGVI